jgi:hypothetical protein
LILVNTVLLAALAEGAARLADWIHPECPDMTFGYAPYRMLRMTRAPWPLNREGFRARELESYRGKFLIEFLGGSVCAGVGTNPGPPLSERLEAELHRAGLARAAVLNLCQGGATSRQELAIFLGYGLPLAPQVVVSFDGANDLMHPRPVGEDNAANLPYHDAEIRARLERTLAADLVPHIALLRVAGRLAKRRAPAPHAGSVAVDEIVGSYVGSVDAVRVLTEAQGGVHVLLLQPTLHVDKPWSPEETAMWRKFGSGQGEPIGDAVRERYGAARRAFARWTSEKGGTVFDLTEAFHATPETVYSDSVHFTGERGFGMLFEEIQRQGLVTRIVERYRQWSGPG